jgi:hypothetical protein
MKRSLTRLSNHPDIKSVVMKEIGGCRNCPWINSLECPHGLKVGEKHANGFCGKLAEMIKVVGSQHYVGLTKQKQYYELVKDQIIADRLLQEYQSGDKTVSRELLDWKKHIHDVMAKVRKQEEGSKLHVDRKIKPSDVLAALRDAEKVVDAEVIDVEEEQDGMRQEETNEEIGEKI